MICINEVSMKEIILFLKYLNNSTNFIKKKLYLKKQAKVVWVKLVCGSQLS